MPDMPDPTHRRTGSIRLAVGSFSDPTDERLTFARQMGCTGVTVNTPRIPGTERWEASDLVALAERVESFGLCLEAIENTPTSFYDKAMLGLPGREQQIDNYCATLEALGAAGIEYLGYHWMPNGVWRTRRDVPGRGGAQCTGFDATLVQSSALRYGFADNEITQAYMVPVANPTLTHGREYTEEEMWEYYAYFMRGVLPTAESAGVKLALHPDDPPVPALGGIPRLMRNRENVDRALSIGDSEHSMLILCVGTWSETGEDLLGNVRHFTRMGRVSFCHFRDVAGTVPAFRECFMGEGDIDFVAVVRTLLDSGFDGFVIDDHVPAMVNDTAWGHRGRALSAGYINALLDAVGPGGASRLD